MKLKLFESENLDFRKSAPSSRSEQVKTSMGDWENQEEINQEFRELVKRELRNPDNKKTGPKTSEVIIDLNHLSQEAYKCTDFSDMFNYTLETRVRMPDVNISEWDVSRGKNFINMFKYYESFNCDLSKWDVSQGRSFHGMFYCCYNFNSDLSNWDVSQGRSFYGMFYSCHNFNSDLSKWDVSHAKNLAGMFAGSPFNQDISNWDVSNVEFFSDMFAHNKYFNKPLHWDVSSGIHFDFMFSVAKSFTGEGLENWDVSNGTDFESMFNDTIVLDVDLSKWDLRGDEYSHNSGMFIGSALLKKPEYMPIRNRRLKV